MRRSKAAVVLTLMAANYGLRAYAHHQALELVPKIFGPTLAAWCDTDDSRNRADRLVAADDGARRRRPEGRRCLVDVAALPTFGSPFQWRIVAQYRTPTRSGTSISSTAASSDSDIEDEAPWRLTLRYPNVWTPTVLQAAQTHLGQVFLGFSRFPAARSAVDARGRPPFAGPTCALPGRSCRANGHWRNRGCSPPSSASTPSGRVVAEDLGTP